MLEEPEAANVGLTARMDVAPTVADHRLLLLLINLRDPAAETVVDHPEFPVVRRG